MMPRWHRWVCRGAGAAIAAVSILVAASLALAGDVQLSQGLASVNQQTTAVAATATVTIGADTGKRAKLYSLDAVCSAGTSTVAVKDGTTTIWATVAAEVTTTRLRVTWPVPLMGSPNTAMAITLTTCGGGNTGTLTVQGSLD